MRGIKAAAATLLAGLLLANPAVAADLGTVDGVNYQSITSDLQTNEAVYSQAGCPPDMRATGAGFSSFNYGAQPQALRPLGTAISVDIYATSPNTVEIFGICTDRSYEYVQRSKPANPVSTTTVKAACPRNRHVAGGGADAGQQYLGSSYPYDSKDKDKKPDDGWKATSYGLQDATFTAIAACSKKMPKYVKDERKLQPSVGHAVAPRCKKSLSVAALGAQTSGPIQFGDLQALKPRDNSSDADQIPDDEGLVHVANSDMAEKPANLTGWAICI